MDERRRAAEGICRRLSDEGFRALLAGGCVRDMLLGVEAQDYDIATSARPDDIQRIFPRTSPVGVAFGVVLVIQPEGVFEVATFRKDGPYLDGRHPVSVEFRDEKEDAQRRDFTVNAMFYDPLTDEVVDYVGGQADMAAGIIRTVGAARDRFQEDHLRLLRAVRFAARLEYEIAEETYDAIRELAPLVLQTSAERIRDEIIKMLTEGHARRAFELLDATGLLEHILPEVKDLQGVEQPEAFHPEGDVWKHTLLLLEGLDKLESPSATLALGALLHDIGKPPTQTFEDRIRFNRHDKVGADMTKQICKRLRLSRHDTERVVWLVDQHMRPAVAPEMRENKRKRFVREEGFDELLQLCFLDAGASHGDVTPFEWLKQYKENLQPESLRPEPLITGKDLISFGYKPGPEFKEILTAVEDAQLEGQLQTREEASAFIAKRWPRG